MTMVALLGNPVKSASLFPRVTPHKPSQMLKEPTVTHPTPQPQKPPSFYPTAALRDNPTDVSTTAGTSNVYDIDDDDRCRTCSSIDDDNSTPDPPFFQEWDDFYKDFKLFINSNGASIVSTQATHTDTIVPAGSVVATSDPPAAAEQDRTTFFKELDALHNELFIHSKGASIVSTQETHTDTIVPAGSVVATSDPPAAAEQDRATFLKELDALHNELLSQSKGASIASTPETPTDTIAPAGSVVAADDPPATAEPDHITFLKELDALHNELTLMLQPSTNLPRTIEATHTQTTVATNDNRDHTVHITAEPNNIETHHTGDQHHDYGSAHHPDDNHDSKDRANETSDPADRPNDVGGHDDHKTDNKKYVECDTTCDNDGYTKPLPQRRHRRQHTPTLPTICHATDHQYKNQTASAPSATEPRDMATTQTGSVTDIQQSPRQTPTDDKSNTTLTQLWRLLAQLEVINNQFAQWLDTFTIEKSTTTPDDSPGIPMNRLDAPSETALMITPSTPSLPTKQPAHLQFATCVREPTGRMFLPLSPLEGHPPTVRIPPWPPPISQPTGHNQDTPWNYTRITNLLPTPATRTLRLTPHRHNRTWPSPILNHIPCPWDFRNKHDHKHVRFRTMTLCHTGPMILWPKEDMRPP